MKLAPSLLASDLANLSLALDQCEKGGADLVHYDVMDGHFVPNLTFGIPVLKALCERTSLPLDVHLMVQEPERLIDGYIEAGAAWISVHWEAAGHLDRLLQHIRSAGVKAGVALNPTTPVESLIDTLPGLDFVVLMSVNPGFGGQTFIPNTLNKARRLRKMLRDQELDHVMIEIDGGVEADNIRQVVLAGVDICVAGSAIFGQAAPSLAMKDLRQRAEK